MVKRRLEAIALTLLLGAASRSGAAAPKAEVDHYQAWRTTAARNLAARDDPGSLATAAALSYAGPPTRSKPDTAKAAAAALELAVKASELAPQNAALSWLRLQLCANVPACDLRDAATTMRWVDADNGAAWMPTLAAAQKDRDRVEVDRVLADMAEGTRFDLYPNRMAVLMFDALKAARSRLPPKYVNSDVARLTEVMGIVAAEVIPPFSPLINACRETAGMERRDSCLVLSKIMQRSDAVMAQLVGFAIERRLSPAESKEARSVADRRHVLEWRVATANQFDAPLLPWVRNARAHSRLKKMRALAREEDVCIAILREHQLPLEPPEDHR
jgi:hypothetical protein